MTLSVAFLVVAVLGLLNTLNALKPPRRPAATTFFSMMASWLTSELPWHTLAWQVPATAVWVAFGALEEWPGVLGLALTLLSWAGVVQLGRRHALARTAMVEELGPDVADDIDKPIPFSRIARPFKIRHPDVEVLADVAYGPHGVRNLCDVYRHKDRPQKAPTLVQLHGGAWVIGNKTQGGLPLMNHLASHGWVCVSANYRLMSKARWPAAIDDVHAVLQWVREHGPEYGADPDFIVLTGGSAGGHLAALAALSWPEHAGGVQGCVPFYGVYDLLDREGFRKDRYRTWFLERRVLRASPVDSLDVWHAASPVDQVRIDAPPFLIIHGQEDILSLVEDARTFAARLREVSDSPVQLVEIPGAQHAFDTFHSKRTLTVVRAVGRYLDDLAKAHREESAAR